MSPLMRLPALAVAGAVAGLFVATAASAGGLAEVLTGALGAGASVLSGGILGGLFRLAPEVLRLFTSKADRDHEYRMAQLSLEASRAAGGQRLAELREAGEQVAGTRGLDALVAAIQGQARPSGVAWVDALSASVRPVVTYWWIAVYSAIKACLMALALADGDGFANAVIGIWTPFDEATLGAILNFWFLDRVLRHRPL